MELNEQKIDIWNFAKENYWLCITTNGILDSKGKAIMGKGLALSAKQKIRGIEITLGKLIKEKGNHVFEIGEYKKSKILSFPTKYHWRNKSDIKLIEQSCQELLKLYLEKERENKSITVVLTKVGCLNGGLNYEKEVRPILIKYFGNNKNFVVCI
jgi:hypothetical protein